MCSFVFTFGAAWCPKAPWFTEIVTSPQSPRPRHYLHCNSLNWEFDRKAKEYVFIWEEVGQDGFVCLWTVVLELVPPPTRIHCCLFGQWLRPLTFPNGWLIPLTATVEPWLLFQECCLPLDLQENCMNFIHDNLITALCSTHTGKQLHEAKV